METCREYIEKQLVVSGFDVAQETKDGEAFLVCWPRGMDRQEAAFYLRSLTPELYTVWTGIGRFKSKKLQKVLEKSLQTWNLEYQSGRR